MSVAHRRILEVAEVRLCPAELCECLEGHYGTYVSRDDPFQVYLKVLAEDIPEKPLPRRPPLRLFASACAASRSQGEEPGGCKGDASNSPQPVFSARICLLKSHQEMRRPCLNGSSDGLELRVHPGPLNSGVGRVRADAKHGSLEAPRLRPHMCVSSGDYGTLAHPR